LQWLRWWWPALVWALLVTSFSTDSFSAENTSRFIIPFLHWLFPGARADTLDFLHFLVRKCAHLSEYFILSLLLVRGIRGERRGWRIQWAIAALALAAGWAGLDELHQAFVPSRGAAMSDVLIDACGAAAGQIAFAVAAWLHARNAGQDPTLDSPTRIV
jgi:VanZ family protein